MIFGFWISTRAWADANAAAVRSFRAASLEGVAYIKDHPEEAKEIEAKYLGVKFPGFSSFDIEVMPADLAGYVSIGKDLGLLRNSIDVTRLIAKRPCRPSAASARRLYRPGVPGRDLLGKAASRWSRTRKAIRSASTFSRILRTFSSQCAQSGRMSSRETGRYVRSMGDGDAPEPADPHGGRA